MQGCIFLAEDVIYIISPIGGYVGNLGIQDADFSIELGLRYNHSGAVKYESTEEDEIVEDPGDPIASPGFRTPHFWMNENAKTSIHDIFSSSEYTLLVCNFSTG